MHDFGAFCYLDMQKTGSSFISTFLRRNSLLPVKKFKKHGRILKEKSVTEGKFFFISSREPLELYISLYSFGMRDKGALHKILLGSNPTVASFYDNTAAGFSNWLAYVLDPANAKILGQGFTLGEAKLYGLMTYRFLVLSFLNPAEVLRGIKSREELLEVYAAKKLHSAVVRNESLNKDMAELVEGPLHPYIRDADAAAVELRAGAKRVNESPREDIFAIGPELQAMLWEREWFYVDVLGYSAG